MRTCLQSISWPADFGYSAVCLDSIRIAPTTLCVCDQSCQCCSTQATLRFFCSLWLFVLYCLLYGFLISFASQKERRFYVRCQAVDVSVRPGIGRFSLTARVFSLSNISVALMLRFPRLRNSIMHQFASALEDVNVKSRRRKSLRHVLFMQCCINRSVVDLLYPYG